MLSASSSSRISPTLLAVTFPVSPSLMRHLPGAPLNTLGSGFSSAPLRR